MPSETVGAQPKESKKERVDRELKELLEETRIILPGLELLFGFLLILPFNERFDALDQIQRVVYLSCVISSALAASLLLAPAARHRLGFRRIDKERLLFMANRYLIAGLVIVAIAIALAVYLAASMMLASRWAALLACSIALCFAFWWFAAPRMHDC